MLKPRYDIVNNYTVLHFDEWDILFAGKNAYNEWIVGSLAYDDEENNVLHHYYLVVSEKSLARFLKTVINYRTLFQEAITIFKTLRDINENLIEKPLELAFEEINEDSLPSEKGFCPETDEQEYILRLILRHELGFSNNWGVFKLNGIIISQKRPKFIHSLKLKDINSYGIDRNKRKYANV